MIEYTKDYLLNEKVIINQPVRGYRAAIDAVLANSCISPSDIKPNSKILDMGSGTGAISLCLAYRLKNKSPQITGIELQTDLCELSNKSSVENKFDYFLKYINLDIKNLRKEIEPNSFDYVVTNPPYTAGGMPSPNVSKATAHIEGEIDLARWIEISIKMIKPKGKFIIVHRADRLDDIIAAIHNKLGGIEIIPLISKQGQDVKRVLVTGVKGSKAPLTLRKAVIIHKNDGDYSVEADGILRLAKSINDI